MDLFVVLVYKDQEIVCIAPFYKKREKFYGIPVNKLGLVGNAYSPFRYLLFNSLDPFQRIHYLNVLLDFLKEQDNSWHVIDFYSIPEENACFESMKKAVARTSLLHSESISYGDWYLDNIAFSGDEYEANLPKKIRKDAAYCRRRLQKTGSLEFKLIKDVGRIDDHMDLYYQVYSKSWQEKEGIGPTFHRDLAKIMAEKGWLRLGFLFFDDTPIAAQFWLAANSTAYILKTVYDQDYRKYSPGKILTMDMFKYVIDADKVTSIDYCQGDEGYKQDWTPKRRERMALLVFNENLKGSFLGLAMTKIKPKMDDNRYLRKGKELLKRVFSSRLD